ncbi:MAG: tetratricopeptide repeat protein, partial [Burkholderiales bacterium]|nr:tetratricopeptide repeat protein [Burkholderiales bacterium]
FVQQELGQFDEALVSFQRAIDLSPSLDRAWFGLGMIHQTRKEHEKAVPVFKKAAELQPMNPHALYELAKAQFALNNLDQVRKIIKRVSEFDPKVTQQLIRETGQVPEGVARR